MDKNVLVCGGAGYIGSMTAKILKTRGYNPIVVDDLRAGHEFLVKFGVLEKCDIGDYSAIDRIIKKYKPIAVMHFAGVSSVPEANANPWQCYNNNVAASNNLIKAMLDNDLKAFVFSSTAAVFGETQSTINEQSPIVPISIYGKSKAMFESMLVDYDAAYGFKSACLRYFNVSGADPDLEVGESHICETHLIPLMLDKAATGGEFNLFGDDYDTKDGTCIRDYIHVYDLANAHVLALEKLLNTNKSFKINLGNGQGFSVKEMVNIAKQVTGIDFKVKISSRRTGDPAVIVTDNTFAKQHLGWEIIYPSPEVHIQHAWEWYKKYKSVVG